MVMSNEAADLEILKQKSIQIIKSHLGDVAQVKNLFMAHIGEIEGVTVESLRENTKEIDSYLTKKMQEVIGAKSVNDLTAAMGKYLDARIKGLNDLSTKPAITFSNTSQEKITTDLSTAQELHTKLKR